MTMSRGWRAEADKKYGVGDNGGKRISTPQALATNAEQSADAGSSWGCLSEFARGEAMKMGIDTPAKQAAFAKNFMGGNGGLSIS
jgi:hypothetical protein